MRGMNKSIFLAGVAAAGAYLSNKAAQITQLQAQDMVDKAYLTHMGLLTANGNTVKEAARMRGRGPNGETVFVPSRKWVDRSHYGPRDRQGERECARRVRQMRKAVG